MNKEELNEALKIIHEPITVNSVEYKYFDIDNYNKLVNVIDYCHYLNNKVKPYVEAQDKEIERLNNIINELEKSAKEIVRVGKNKGYQYVENLNELKTKEEIYDFIEFYYGLYLLEQLDKLKELKNK